MSKISNDTIGNPTRDLPTCSAVPHTTAVLHPIIIIIIIITEITAVIRGTYFIWQLSFVTSADTSVRIRTMGWAEYVSTINEPTGSDN